jgi:hypothetical protein
MDHTTQVTLFIAFGYFFYLGGVRFLASRTTRIGRGILQPSADDLRAVDPIVFLRSFHDDELKVKGRDGYSRLEEIISKQLPLFGPLIAIGKPGELLPTLGAAPQLRFRFGMARGGARLAQASATYRRFRGSFEGLGLGN